MTNFDRDIQRKLRALRHAEMKRLDIRGDTFHPEWNYTVMPRTTKSL